jgi:hypothetical protein
MPSTRRLIVVALVAAAILLALVIAMGGTTLPSPTAGAITSPPTSAPSAAPTGGPTQPSGAVKGTVTVSVRHVSRHTWHFIYAVRNAGKVPIAGFELNAASSNLFHIKGPAWNVFGSGVCKGNNPGLLVYWSTTSGATNHISPGHSARFSFDVNTSGPISMAYSLSYGTSAPQFGQTKGPAGSTLPASGPCT